MPNVQTVVIAVFFLGNIIDSSEKVLISKLCLKNGLIISELQEVELGYKVIYICDVTGKFTRTCIMCNDNSSQRGEWTKPECVLSVKKDSMTTNHDSEAAEVFNRDTYNSDYTYNSVNGYYHTYDDYDSEIDDKEKETRGGNENNNFEKKGNNVDSGDNFKNNKDSVNNYKDRLPPKDYSFDIDTPKSYYNPAVRKNFDENFNEGGFLKYTVCSRPKEIPNSVLRVSGEGADTIAYYSCNKGFRPVGSTVRKCLENKTWSGVAPHCLPDYAQPTPVHFKTLMAFIVVTLLRTMF